MATSSSTVPSQAELDAYIGNRLIVTAVFFLVIETTCVALRITSRRLTSSPVGFDDILIIPAFLLCASVSGVGIATVEYGGCGRHADALAYTDPEKLVNLSKLIIVLTCVYVWSAAVPKLVILALYLRLFTIPIYRRIIFVLGGIIIANMIGAFTAGLLQCLPFAFNWDTKIPDGHCFNRVVFFEFTSLANIVTDVGMLVLPLRVVWNLHTDRSTKLGLMAIFLAGSIGLITSIVRFWAFAAEDLFTDISWATVNLNIFTIVEPGTYLIAGCLTTFRALFLYCTGQDPNSPVQSGPHDVSTSAERRGRVWLNRVFERTSRRTEEDSIAQIEGLTFNRASRSKVTTHAESRNLSPGCQSMDGFAPADIRVEHELHVISS